MKSQITAVVGLGQVGLLLAVEFGELDPTMGFDIPKGKVEKYRQGVALSCHQVEEQARAALNVRRLWGASDFARTDLAILAVATPADNKHVQDFQPLIAASAFNAYLPKEAFEPAGFPKWRL